MTLILIYKSTLNSEIRYKSEKLKKVRKGSIIILDRKINKEFE